MELFLTQQVELDLFATTETEHSYTYRFYWLNCLQWSYVGYSPDQKQKV